MKMKLGELVFSFSSSLIDPLSKSLGKSMRLQFLHSSFRSSLTFSDMKYSYSSAVKKLRALKFELIFL